MPDWGLDDFDAPPAVDESKAPSRELVPEGEHDFQIRQVTNLEDGRVEFRLVHDERRYGWVFAKIPKDKDWGKRILSGLRTACGMSREQWQAVELTDLAGRRVKARVYHKAGNRGGTFVNLGEFLSVTPEALAKVEAPAAKPTARRTATQKADASAAMPEDDIPF